MPAGSGRARAGLAISRRAVLAGLAVAAASACTQIEFLAANVPAVFGAYRRHADISYGTDPRQRLDLYVPEKAASARTPVVVFWHGGRWSEGDKSQYRFVGAALTTRYCWFDAPKTTAILASSCAASGLTGALSAWLPLLKQALTT